MNNRIKYFFLLFLIIGIFSSFKINKNIYITGYVTSYGNDPVTYLGIKTPDQKEIGIIANDEIINDLKKMGGTLIEFEGQYADDNEIPAHLKLFKDGVFIVSSWKVAKYVRSRDTSFKPLTRPFLGFVLNPK